MIFHYILWDYILWYSTLLYIYIYITQCWFHHVSYLCPVSNGTTESSPHCRSSLHPPATPFASRRPLPSESQRPPRPPRAHKHPAGADVRRRPGGLAGSGNEVARDRVIAWPMHCHIWCWWSLFLLIFMRPWKLRSWKVTMKERMWSFLKCYLKHGRYRSLWYPNFAELWVWAKAFSHSPFAKTATVAGCSGQTSTQVFTAQDFQGLLRAINQHAWDRHGWVISCRQTRVLAFMPFIDGSIFLTNKNRGPVCLFLFPLFS